MRLLKPTAPVRLTRHAEMTWSYCACVGAHMNVAAMAAAIHERIADMRMPPLTTARDVSQMAWAYLYMDRVIVHLVVQVL